MTLHKIVITVKSVKGHCEAGHKVGDTIEIIGANLKGRICPSALCSIYPITCVMKYGGALGFPAERQEEKDRITLACPDPVNQVVFEVVRKEKIRD